MMKREAEVARRWWMTNLGEKLRTVPMVGGLGWWWARWPGSSCFRSHTARLLGTRGARQREQAKDGWFSAST